MKALFFCLIALHLLIWNCNFVLSSKDVSTNRQSKMGIWYILPHSCTSMIGETKGYCNGAVACMARGGIVTGLCMDGPGICCFEKRSCGSTMTAPMTYFLSLGYPKTYVGEGTCTTTVKATTDNIVQVKLVFEEVILAQPNVDGNCDREHLRVTGSDPAFDIPTLCGNLTGQHMYIKYNPSSREIRLTVTFDNEGLTDKSIVNIRVYNIYSLSSERAPDGCLQYYTSQNGNVNSFNSYPTTTSAGVPVYQLANMNYRVCLKSDTRVSVEWRQVGRDGFLVSDSYIASIAGTPAGSKTDGECTTDYVQIEEGNHGTALINDKFCSIGFPTTVTSSVWPFTLYVVTNGNEGSDAGNAGFKLSYAMT